MDCSAENGHGGPQGLTGDSRGGGGERWRFDVRLTAATREQISDLM